MRMADITRYATAHNHFGEASDEQGTTGVVAAAQLTERRSMFRQRRHPRRNKIRFRSAKACSKFL
jgi:hypothetical protein